MIQLFSSPEVVCRRCGYFRRGIGTEVICPECGLAPGPIAIDVSVGAGPVARIGAVIGAIMMVAAHALQALVFSGSWISCALFSPAELDPTFRVAWLVIGALHLLAMAQFFPLASVLLESRWAMSSVMRVQVMTSCMLTIAIGTAVVRYYLSDFRIGPEDYYCASIAVLAWCMIRALVAQVDRTVGSLRQVAKPLSTPGQH